MSKKTIALGTSDFKEVVEGNHYLVDKSLFIKEGTEDGSKVILLPRPRRWGKTLNMSMLKYFFEKTDQSNRHLFNGLAIEQYPEIMRHQGKYPVIFLTLKDAKKMDWESCYDMLQDVITKEYERKHYLLESNILTGSERVEYEAILSKTAKQLVYERALSNLSSCLHRYHGVAPIVLIDEYDAPVISGFENGYYKEIVNFIQTFLGAALKDAQHIKKSFLTGILRVSKESIFSGLNNVSVCTLINNEYAEHFGFSEKEVVALLEYYDEIDNLNRVRAWYNGYQVGQHTTMYNPWSVLAYAKTKELFPHWMNSANNNLIKMIIQKSSARFKEDIEQLMLGKIIERELVDYVTFDSLFSSPDIAFNFFLLTGYLSFKKRELKGIRHYLSFIIPNEEIEYFFQTTVMQWIQETIDISTYQSMLLHLTEGDVESFKETFERVVERVLSSLDTADDEPEKFYHMFVLGMLVSLQETHEVKSNRESGGGRYDVMIIPKDRTKIGIIIEFKRAKNMSDEALEVAVIAGLKQIKDKNYQAELVSRGIMQIINVAIAFAGKRVLVNHEAIST